MDDFIAGNCAIRNYAYIKAVNSTVEHQSPGSLAGE